MTDFESFKCVSLFAISREDADKILVHLESVYNIGAVQVGATIGQRAERLNLEIKAVGLGKRFCAVHDHKSVTFSDSNHHRPDETVVFCRNCGLCK